MGSGEADIEKDMKDFEFVQLCRFRVTNPNFSNFTGRSQMVACSSTYGLVIYSTVTGFNVVRTSDLLSVDESTGAQRNKVTIEEFPILSKVTLSSPALVLSISSDGATLAVMFQDNGQMVLVFFDIHGFANSASLQPFAKLPLGSGTMIIDLAWNPALPTMLAVCYSDGAMALVDVKDSPQPGVIASLPVSVGATCFSWSPKGKQLLVGKKDGTLSQYDHALTEKKKWACPNVFNTGQTVVDVVWLSTYMFVAAYLTNGAVDADQPIVVLTNSNKENNTTYVNFDDVCFSSSEDRKPQYMFHNVQKWEVVLAASTRATEATLIGKNLDNKVSWEHWNLEDSSRAELPLTSEQCDSFPLGMAVDYSPQKTVSYGETKTFPACPIMYLLSTDGLLLAYHLYYSHKDAVAVTIPPQPLNPGQSRKGVPGLLRTVVPQSLLAPPPSLTTASTVPASSSAFGTTNLFGSTTGSAPAKLTAPSFQFVKPATSDATSSSDKPSLSSAASGQSSSGSFFGFGTNATTTSNPGQSSAFATPPTSSQASTFGGSSFSFTSPTNPPAPPTNQQGTSSNTKPPPMAGNISLKPQQTGTAADATKSSIFGTPSDGAKASSIFGTTSGATTKSSSNFGGGSSQPSSSSANSVSNTTSFGTMGAALPAPLSTPSTFGGGSAKPTSTSEATSSLFGANAGAGKQMLPRASKPASSSNPLATTVPAKPVVNVPVVSSSSVAGAGGRNSVIAQASVVPRNAPVNKIMPQNKAPMGGVTPQQASVDSRNISIEATVDGAFSQNIVEEIAHFEEEMRNLRARSKREVKTIGTHSEMHILRRGTEETVNFLSEIKDVVKEQLQETRELKSNCHGLSADVEKSGTQIQRDTDPHYHSLLQGRALDPASAQQLRTIQQMAQVLEQTLSEVNHTLDSQWEQHMAQKTRQAKISAPTGDAIFKTIKNNHQIIIHQRRSLDKLEEKMSNLRLSGKENRMDNRLQAAFCKSLNTSSDSPLSLDKQNGSSPSPRKPLTLKAAVNKGMTPNKVSRAKDFLSQRRVSLVKSKTPTTPSMSRILANTPSRSFSVKTLQQQKSLNVSDTPQSKQLPQRQQQQSGLSSNSPHGQGMANTGQNKTLFSSNLPTYPSTTPLGIPSAELRLQKGMLPIQDQMKSTPFNMRPSPSTTTPPTANMLGGNRGLDGVSPPQRLPSPHQQPQFHQSQQVGFNSTNAYQGSSGAPTSFSGVAYFKQPMPTPTGGTALSLAQQQQLQAATQVLGKHLGLSSLTSMVSKVGITLPPPTQSTAIINQQQQQQPVYEDITPFETDDDEDEEDDEYGYDVDEDGYEDEYDEEEEEDDKVGNGFSFGESKQSPLNPMDGKTTIPQSTALTSDTAAWSGFGSTPASSSMFGATTTGASSATSNTKNTGFSFGGNSGTTFGNKPLASVASLSTSQPQAAFGGAAVNQAVGFGDLAKVSASSKLAGLAASSTDSKPMPSISTGFGLPPNYQATTLQGSESKSAATSSSATSGTTKKSSFEISSILEGTTSATPSASSSSVATTSANQTASNQSSATTAAQPPLKTTTVSTSATTAGFIIGGGVGQSSATFTAAAVSAPSLFKVSGEGSSTSATTSSLFGNATTAATTTTSTKPSVFGGSTAATSPSSLFGQGSSSPSSFNFGNATATTTTTGVNSSATTTTNNSTLFGSNSTTSNANGDSSVFGGGSMTTTTTSSLFGGNNSTTVTTTSPFATNKPITSGPSLFGGNASSTSTFGAVTAANSSPFGAAATTTANPSPFGSTTAAATASPFGATTSTSSVFGGNSTTTSGAFGAGAGMPLFGSSQPATGSSSLFGGSSMTAASTGSSLFGQTGSTTTGSTGFSFNTPPSATGSTFGSSSSTGFGFSTQPSTTNDQSGNGSGGAAGMFGGFGLGAKPSEEKAKTNVFGTPQTFGAATTSQNSLFGSSSSSPFGNTAGSDGGSTFGNANAFGGGGGGGSFSGGTTGVAAAGFGISNTAASTSSGFGAPPSFGSAPNFGSGSSPFGGGAKPGFGSPSSFGSGATFGSMGNTSNSGSVFGSAGGNTSSTGFANFASSAPTFDQLAQANTNPGGAFGGGAQASPFGGGAGGNSFGGASPFGQSAPGGGFGSPQPSFGNQGSTGFGSSPAFSSYRG